MVLPLLTLPEELQAHFVLLLTECEADSALFTGLLSFAEGAVSAGVKGAFDPVSDAQRELVVKAASVPVCRHRRQRFPGP